MQAFCEKVFNNFNFHFVNNFFWQISCTNENFALSLHLQSGETESVVLNLLTYKNSKLMKTIKEFLVNELETCESRLVVLNEKKGVMPFISFVECYGEELVEVETMIIHLRILVAHADDCSTFDLKKEVEILKMHIISAEMWSSSPAYVLTKQYKIMALRKLVFNIEDLV